MSTRNEMASRAEELRQQALAHSRAENYDLALELFDEALALVEGEDEAELLTINKADALIAAGRPGPEVHALSAILLRRRNPHHTFLAAYALMFKFRTQNETRRAITHGETALRAAIEADQPFWKLAALNDLGIIYEIDSQFDKAIASFEEALTLTPAIADPAERRFSETAILQNLGYNRLLIGDTEAGLEIIHSILDRIEVPSSLPDSYIDLCYGYLALKQLDTARHYGEIGLELAREPRQLRNAHYLLGEVAYEAGDIESAERHFDEIGRYYPEFKNIKNILFALDLRGIVNLRL